MKPNFLNHGPRASLLMCFAAADGGGSGAAAAEPKTLSDALAALATARNETATAKGTIVAITKERDDARAEVTQVKGQFEAATSAAEKAQTDLATANAAIGNLTKERDQARGDLSKAADNVARLEKLCGVRGIDPNAAAPVVDDAANDSGAQLAKQWMDMKAAGKTREAMAFYQANQAALDAWSSANA